MMPDTQTPLSRPTSDSIGVGGKLPQQPDDLSAAQAKAYENEQTRNSQSTRTLREGSARLAFGCLCGLSVAVFVILLMHGFKFYGFQLDTTVLTTLAGGTFVSTIGLFGIVVKGLFPTSAP